VVKNMAEKMGRQVRLDLGMTQYGLAAGVVLETQTVVHGVDPVDAGWLGSAEALYMIPCDWLRLCVYRAMIRLLADDVARAREISVTWVH
jgi:hypothetical protein